MNKEEFEEMLDATVYVLSSFIKDIMELYSLTKEEYLDKQDEFAPIITLGLEALLSVNYGKEKSESFLRVFSTTDVDEMVKMYLR